ncbi:hypothetical protein ACFU8Q_37585 [Streptomyces sp. NPDC057543]|uniref:hypothetical protein n=1 Tax=Streptomyces sp. NPDC057543 TaxID=3346163 RepID=UPI0036894CEB
MITAIYGRGGLSRSAETVHEDELPAGSSAEQVEQSVVPLLARLIADRSEHFVSRSALTAPAVLAGLGIAEERRKTRADGVIPTPPPGAVARRRGGTPGPPWMLSSPLVKSASA